MDTRIATKNSQTHEHQSVTQRFVAISVARRRRCTRDPRVAAARRGTLAPQFFTVNRRRSGAGRLNCPIRVPEPRIHQ